MTDSMRDRIDRVLGKDRLHELDKPVFGGRQLSDKQIEEIADALLEAFPWLADEREDEDDEGGALSRIAELEAEVEQWRRVAVEQTRLERDRAEAVEAKLAAVREFVREFALVTLAVLDGKEQADEQ